MPFQGLLTLWAVRNDSLFEAAVEHNIVSGVSAILSEALPDYQPRWLKGVAGVIVTQAIVSCFQLTKMDITNKYTCKSYSLVCLEFNGLSKAKIHISLFLSSQLFLTTRHPITLLEIIQQHVSFQDTLKSFLTPLQKIQLAIYSDIKANPSKSMVGYQLYFNLLSPNIQIQILQTDLHTSPLRIS